MGTVERLWSITIGDKCVATARTSKNHFWVKYVDAEVRTMTTGYGDEWLILRASATATERGSPCAGSEPARAAAGVVTITDVLQA